MATNEAQETGFSSLGFVRQFVFPALLVFLIPTASLLFFRHAQATLDAQVFVTPRRRSTPKFARPGSRKWKKTHRFPTKNAMRRGNS